MVDNFLFHNFIILISILSSGLGCYMGVWYQGRNHVAGCQEVGGDTWGNSSSWCLAESLGSWLDNVACKDQYQYWQSSSWCYPILVWNWPFVSRKANVEDLYWLQCMNNCIDLIIIITTTIIITQFEFIYHCSHINMLRIWVVLNSKGAINVNTKNALQCWYNIPVPFRCLVRIVSVYTLHHLKSRSPSWTKYIYQY